MFLWIRSNVSSTYARKQEIVEQSNQIIFVPSLAENNISYPNILYFYINRLENVLKLIFMCNMYRVVTCKNILKCLAPDIFRLYYLLLAHEQAKNVTEVLLKQFLRTFISSSLAQQVQTCSGRLAELLWVLDEIINFNSIACMLILIKIVKISIYI